MSNFIFGTLSSSLTMLLPTKSPYFLPTGIA